MRFEGLLVLILAPCLVCPGVEGLRVLGLFPVPAYSHFIMFKAMMEALVERGHEVVVLSPFPSKTPPPNYTDIDTSLGRPSLVGTFTFEMVRPAALLPLPGSKALELLVMVRDRAGNQLCRDVFSMPEFRRVLAGGYGRFDVVFTEVFGSDCWAAVAHKLAVPLVSMSSAPDVSWMHDRLGSVDNPAYIANVLTEFRGGMTFWQRLENLATRLVINYLHTAWLVDGSDAVVREFLGEDVPPLRDIIRNTSLMLLNRHVSIHAARPVTPNQVHVGGLHIKAPPGALQPALRRWMDEAEHGVVFFSLGSLIRGDSLPAAMRDALLGAFATLPQRVLWKFESDDLVLPPNVRVAKWLPQLDVLTHPKTVLFFTHGGLMGTLESLHCGVPMLGLPLFADQMSNIEHYMWLGVAEKLDLVSLTKESTASLIKTMTTDSRYRSRAREVSALFRDRPQQAADEAVWWTEYVVRHGATHLRPLGADLPVYQYLLLDVAAFCVACVLIVLLVLWRVLRAICCRPARTSDEEKRKKKKI